MAKTVERRPFMSRIGEPWPRVFDWFETLVPGDPGWRNGYPHSMRVEEFSRNGNLVFRVEIPGVDPDKDIDITVDEGLLTIEGRREVRKEEPSRSEFFYGHFMRSLPLPMGVSEKDIRAQYVDGILEISVKMPAKEGKAIHVPVSRGGKAA